MCSTKIEECRVPIDRAERLATLAPASCTSHIRPDALLLKDGKSCQKRQVAQNEERPSVRLSPCKLDYLHAIAMKIS